MQNTMTPEEKTAKKQNLEGQYLIFEANNIRFGIDVFQVKGVIALRELEIMIDMPERIRGRIDLFGKSLYILDPGIIMGKSAIHINEKSCGIIVENNGNQIGMATEQIQQVGLLATNTETKPGDDSLARFTQAVATDGTIILDLEKMLNDNDFRIAA